MAPAGAGWRIAGDGDVDDEVGPHLGSVAVKVDKYVGGDVLESLAGAMVALCLGDHGVSAFGLPTGRTDRGVLDEQFVHLLEAAFVEVDAEPVHEVGDLRPVVELL